MAFSNKKIETLLQQGKTALNNTVGTPEIQTRFDKYGYTADGELAQGQTYLQTLDEKVAENKRLYAVQKEATAAFKVSWKEARKLYKRHAKIADAVLAEKQELLGRLGLQGARARKFVEWQPQAQQFYREALADNDLQTLLLEGGLTAAVLQGGEVSLASVIESDQKQESAKGVAQQSTQDRDAAAKVFQAWFRKYWKIADVALADQPQWLERLGKVVKS